VFPQARFCGKIPEQSEDDFFANRFSGPDLSCGKEHGAIFAYLIGMTSMFSFLFFFIFR